MAQNQDAEMVGTTEQPYDVVIIGGGPAIRPEELSMINFAVFQRVIGNW